MALATGATLGFAVLSELLGGERQLSFRPLAAALGLAMLVGLPLGLLLGLAMRALSSVPRWARLVGAGALALSSSAILAMAHEVPSKLAGPHWKAALAALVGSFGAGAVYAGCALALVPSRTTGRCFANGCAPWLRGTLFVLTAFLASACYWADAALFPGNYVWGHLALRVASIALLMVALVAALPTSSTLGAAPRGLWLSAGTLFVGGLVAVAGLRGPGDVHEVLAYRYSRRALLIARTFTDIDRDGYSHWLGGGDCAPLDSAVHPFAADLPGDGIDQDCHGGDAPAEANRPTVRAAQLVPAAAASARPNIVLITVDSLRADHMGLYGAEHDTTPNLQAWVAEHAVRFDRAYTSGGWTCLALSSMLRGRYPRRLPWTRVLETTKLRLVRRGAFQDPGDDEAPAGLFTLVFDSSHSLPRLLAARGYRTAAVLDGGMTGYFDKELSAFQGFDDYLSHERGMSWADDAETTRRAIEVLRGLPTDRPFLLWVHYFGPHAPDSVYADVPQFGSGVRARYEHEIAKADRAIATLLNAIAAERTERKTATIITSDHGENIDTYGRAHGILIDEGATRIPLVVSWPDVPPAVVRTPVSLVDVLPTILGMAGATGAAEDLDGDDLSHFVGQAGEPRDRRVVAETWRFDLSGALVLNRVAMVSPTHRVTLDLLTLEEVLYEVGPQEREVPWNERGMELRNQLRDYLAEVGPIRAQD